MIDGVAFMLRTRRGDCGSVLAPDRALRSRDRPFPGTPSHSVNLPVGEVLATSPNRDRDGSGIGRILHIDSGRAI
jgi:hypothetical protein